MNWELLLKYTNKESNTSENIQVESWLNEQAENVYLLNYLQKRREQLQQPLKQADIDEQWQQLLNRIFETPSGSSPTSSKPYWFMGIAASLLLISIISYLYTTKYSLSNQQFTLQTKANMRGKITLPDGTEVYMAPNSKIKYDNTFGADKRVVRLSGEAFFNVIHNTHKPFIIYTESKLAVTVLGTSFSIYARDIHHVTEVKVASGLVGITENRHTHLLGAGQQLSYLAGQQQVTMKKVAYNDAVALQKQTLFFEDNNADEIAEKLQRWYNVTVKVMPSARKHPRFSGEMKDTGINNLMKGLEYATGINYQCKNSHTIVLF